MEKNYEEYDYLQVEVKKGNYKKVAKCYNCLGWKQIEINEHETYGDTLVASFERRHKQKNKDKLQLAQVRLENKFSELAKLERNHYSRAIIFGLSTLLVLALFLALGIYFIVQNLTEFTTFGGIMITALSSVLIILAIVKTKVMKSEDDEKFKKNSKKINDEISSLCEQAKKLVGEKANGKE